MRPGLKGQKLLIDGGYLVEADYFLTTVKAGRLRPEDRKWKSEVEGADIERKSAGGVINHSLINVA